jgi:hypothetical protein
MPDNVKVLQGVGDSTVAPPIATDDIGGIQYQRIKVGWGGDGTFNELVDTDGIRLPIGGAQVGPLTETAPASDTASSGLNGRLQRIAQRLTSLIGLFPATLGQKTMAASLAVTLASDQPAALMLVVRREAVIALTVTSGTRTSTTADTAGYGNMGLVVPSTFDGTQIYFDVSHDGSTFASLYDITNTPVLMTVTAYGNYDLPGELMAWRYMRLYCATVQATTDTVFQLVLRS